MTTEAKRKSSSDFARDRAALRDAVPAVAALIAVEASVMIGNPDSNAGIWSLLWLLSPILPAAWLVWVQFRSLARADEFQRRRQLESLAIGFAAATMLAFLGGLAGQAQLGNPTQWLQITFVGAILVWVGALAVTSRRER